MTWLMLSLCSTKYLPRMMSFETPSDAKLHTDDRFLQETY
jgi:hypothetical protein